MSIKIKFFIISYAIPTYMPYRIHYFDHIHVIRDYWGFKEIAKRGKIGKISKINLEMTLFELFLIGYLQELYTTFFKLKDVSRGNCR